MKFKFFCDSFSTCSFKFGIFWKWNKLFLTPTIIALFNNQDPCAFSQRQLVSLLCLIIIFNSGTSDRFWGIWREFSAHGGRRWINLARWRWVRERSRVCSLFHLLLEAVEQRHWLFLLFHIVARYIARSTVSVLHSPPVLAVVEEQIALVFS